MLLLKKPLLSVLILSYASAVSYMTHQQPEENREHPAQVLCLPFPVLLGPGTAVPLSGLSWLQRGTGQCLLLKGFAGMWSFQVHLAPPHCSKLLKLTRWWEGTSPGAQESLSNPSFPNNAQDSVLWAPHGRVTWSSMDQDTRQGAHARSQHTASSSSSNQKCVLFPNSCLQSEPFNQLSIALLL